MSDFFAQVARKTALSEISFPRPVLATHSMPFRSAAVGTIPFEAQDEWASMRQEQGMPARSESAFDERPIGHDRREKPRREPALDKEQTSMPRIADIREPGRETTVIRPRTDQPRTAVIPEPLRETMSLRQPTDRLEKLHPEMHAASVPHPSLEPALPPLLIRQSRVEPSGYRERQASEHTEGAPKSSAIKVSIGRIEVRAVVANPTTTTRPAAQPKPRSALQEYLDARNRGKL